MKKNWCTDWLLRELVFVAVLVLSVIALYGFYLDSPPVFDDFSYFSVDAGGKLSIKTDPFNVLQLRSLPSASMAWTLDFAGESALKFLRMGNILLHIGVVLSIYGCSKEVWRTSIHGGIAHTPLLHIQWVAFLLALVFGLHPLSVYATAYLVQRTTLMATLFSLWALWSYCYGIRRQMVVWQWLCVPLYYLAVFSKELAVMLALLFPLLSVTLDPHWRIAAKQQRFIWLTLLLIGGWVVVLKRQLIGESYEPNAMQIQTQLGTASPYISSLLTQCWLYFRYIFLWFYPDTQAMSVDVRVAFADSLYSAYAIAAALYLLWGLTALRIIRGPVIFRTAGLAMLVPWLMFFTELAAVRLQEPFVLYRSYLWAALSGVFLAVFLSRWYAHKLQSPGPIDSAQKYAKKGIGLALLFAALGFGLSVERLETFTNEWLLWADAEEQVHGRQDLSGSYRIYFNLAVAESNVGLAEKAVAHAQTAIQLHPDFPSAFGLLAGISASHGEWQEAEKAYTQAIDLTLAYREVPVARLYFARAYVREKMGKQSLALNDYQTLCTSYQLACDKVR